MSDKELKQLKKRIASQEKKVATNKEYAKKFLIDLGILTNKGNLKRQFKSV